MNWYPSIKTIVDGVDRVSGTTVNPILTALADRDEYLKEQLANLEATSVVMAYNLPIASGAAVGVNKNPVVYFSPTTNSTSASLDLGLATFNSTVDPTHLTQALTGQVFGIVANIYNNSAPYYADVYLSGLISFTPGVNNLDAPSYASGITAGAMYLSTLTPGTLTYTPSSASVFVGYNFGNGQFLLAPNKDSLNELYINYRAYLLPRAVGTTAKNGTTNLWSITNSSGDVNTLGWVDATFAASTFGITAPANAKFFYNLPTIAYITADSSLTLAQKNDALLLKKALPPCPGAYTNLYMNGVLQEQFEPARYDTTLSTNDTTNGTYCITSAGIWWCNSLDGYIPWSSSSQFSILIQTTKLNPNYQSTVVTSVAAYNSSDNNTASVLTVQDAVTGLPATTGNLQLKFNLPVVTTGSTSTPGQTVNGLAYNQVTGQLVLTMGSLISSVATGPGLTVNTVDGVATINLSNYTLSGEVSDVEPEESDFTYLGLHSYLRLKTPTGNQRSGFVGKLLLPQVIPAGTPLNISLLAAGASTANQNASFLFQYAVTQPGQALSSAVTSANSGSPILINGWTTSVQSVGGTSFQVPASPLVAGGYLNFRLTRIATSNVYSSDINVAGVFWAITN